MYLPRNEARRGPGTTGERGRMRRDIAGSPRGLRIRISSYSPFILLGAASAQVWKNKGCSVNSGVGKARIGQWYLHRDKGEMFQVTGYDERSRTIEIQTFDGELDEIDDEAWTTLPLGLAEPPEDWTGPIDDVEVDDLGYSETEMTAKDWSTPLEPFRVTQEAWQDTTEDEEDAPEVEGLPREDLIVDNTAARDLAADTK